MHIIYQLWTKFQIMHEIYDAMPETKIWGVTSEVWEAGRPVVGAGVLEADSMSTVNGSDTMTEKVKAEGKTFLYCIPWKEATASTEIYIIEYLQKGFMTQHVYQKEEILTVITEYNQCLTPMKKNETFLITNWGVSVTELEESWDALLCGNHLWVLKQRIRFWSFYVLVQKL